MSMKEAILNVLNNYANFSGRARRSEYWYFVLFYGIVVFALSTLSRIVGSESILASIIAGISGLFSLAILVPNLAVTWRRLHDIGKSGGFYFICLIPVVGTILLLVWLCRDSEPGENQYGPSPKA